MGMSTEEYEAQKKTGRFRILDVDDAKAIGAPGADCYDEDWRCLLVEFVDDKPVRIVGSDGGAPEDQSLLRDWQWVAFELNAADTAIREAAKLEGKRELLGELENLCRGGHLHGVAREMVSRLRTKYQPADSQPAQDGERR